MHTSMFIWKPHPGKVKEMREMVITIRDHCRRIGGANEVNCAALQGSFFGHFAVAMRCDNGIDTEKVLEGFRADSRSPALRQACQDFCRTESCLHA